MILVCGGAGYIGSHAVRRLLEMGEKVVVADNLSTGHQQAVDPGAVFCQGDLRDASFVNQLFRRHSIESVMHFAAFSQVGQSMTDPLMYYDNNLGGTLCLLKEMERQRIKKMVFSSTAAVYGEPSQTPVEETEPTRPTNPYGETKLAVERMLHWANHSHGLQPVVFRYFNVAGAHPRGDLGENHQPETHLIPLVLDTAKGERDHIQVYGNDYDTPDGTCIRDYIHVCDLVEAHVTGLRRLRQGAVPQVYNLGNNNGFSVMEIIHAAERVTGRPIPVVQGQRRPGDPARLVASSEKAASDLQWEPRYSHIDTIIDTAWQWHQRER